jgi:hypothetical protein
MTTQGIANEETGSVIRQERIKPQFAPYRKPGSWCSLCGENCRDSVHISRGDDKPAKYYFLVCLRCIRRMAKAAEAE